MAANDIVVMTDTLTKEEMHIKLATALKERGINPMRTKIGQNIICRVGDPTDVNDLIRVGAHRAAAIVVMLTDQDNAEEDYSDGAIKNGATLRCALALRHVIFGNPFPTNGGLHPELRIILQMTSPSSYVNAACFKNAQNLDVIMPMDLSVFLNSLMFSCATQPGLATVLLDILNFEGTSIRRRKAKNLKSGWVKDENGKWSEYGQCIGKTFGECRKKFTKAVFIGIMRPSIQDKAEIIKQGLGICPDPNTIIEKEDLLIFIGPKSNPIHDDAMADTMNGYISEARSMIKQYNPQGVKTEKNLKHILLCGWRPVWEDSPTRFKARCKDLMKLRLPGSTITMLNSVEKERFSFLMEGIGFARGEDEKLVDASTSAADSRFVENKNEMSWTFSNEAEFPGVKIIHVHGDASLPSVLEPVIMKTSMNTAIVLGTQASVRLNAHSRDTRVLSIMLLLRQLCNIKGAKLNDFTPMHIVGENQQDLTAKLALAPRVATIVNPDGQEGDVQQAPDFINTQAIYARAITQTMAYPLIAPAVADLFADVDGTAKIEIVRAGAYVPMEIFAQRPEGIPYGMIRAAVLQATGERSICIGYMLAKDGSIALTPDHFKLVHLGDRDKLVVLRRMLIQTANTSAGGGGATLNTSEESDVVTSSSDKQVNEEHRALLAEGDEAVNDEDGGIFTDSPHKP
jgi:hypothetical protein